MLSHQAGSCAELRGSTQQLCHEWTCCSTGSSLGVPGDSGGTRLLSAEPCTVGTGGASGRRPNCGKAHNVQSPGQAEEVLLDAVRYVFTAPVAMQKPHVKLEA